MRTFARPALIVVVLSAMVAGFAGPASAHVEKKVGSLRFTVGWGDEPTYAGFKNSVQLVVADDAGKPVTDLGDSVKVEIVFSGQTVTLPLEPTFDPDSGEGTPGDYRAWFIPTRPGNYTFHFTGTYKGQKVDERFTSSETTFDPVKDPTEVQFPAKDPSNGQLADRITSDEAANAAVKKAAGNGKSTAGLALILAIAGLAIAVAGTVASLMRTRTKS